MRNYQALTTSDQMFRVLQYDTGNEFTMIKTLVVDCRIQVGTVSGQYYRATSCLSGHGSH
jgi:hypothetical protein